MAPHDRQTIFDPGIVVTARWTCLHVGPLRLAGPADLPDRVASGRRRRIGNAAASLAVDREPSFALRQRRMHAC
jgi:hypothetical protein